MDADQMSSYCQFIHLLIHYCDYYKVIIILLLNNANDLADCFSLYLQSLL
jgi:hypothetical protein